MTEVGHVLRDGKYYYPAFMRYADEPFAGVVTCDACDACNISACVGAGEHDLCMSCMRTLVSIDDRMRRRQAAQELDDAPFELMAYAT
jgi:hypothetical protein